MLLQTNRLRKQKDFDDVFQRSRAAGNKFFILRFCPNRQKSSRFGLVVGGQVSKKAVERNRLRRQLSEILRLNFPRLKTGFDIIVIVKPPALKKKALELKESFLGLLAANDLYA